MKYSLEHYSKSEPKNMWALAGLIRASYLINNLYAKEGIHVKAVVPQEIFTHLNEKVLLNPSKDVQNELLLDWTPNDLLRLGMFRYYKYIRSIGEKPMRTPREFRSLARRVGSSLENPMPQKINWVSSSQVKSKIWDRYFPHEIVNRNGQREDCLNYILRHTHLLPRQFVMILNHIANLSYNQNNRSIIHPEAVVNGIKDTEDSLVRDLINSYGRIYPAASDIVNALGEIPIFLSGERLRDELENREIRNFCSIRETEKVLIRIGAIGKVHEQGPINNIIYAKFRYTDPQGFRIIDKGEYAFHPLFFGKLQIINDKKYMVYPVEGTYKPSYNYDY